jgi:hypothetical protein
MRRLELIKSARLSESNFVMPALSGVECAKGQAESFVVLISSELYEKAELKHTTWVEACTGRSALHTF